MAANSEEASGIDNVRSRFEQWRKTRARKTAIPDELWSMAASVARREGVNRTAQQLHLDGGKLKRILMAADTGQRTRKRRPGFVELVAPDATAGCVIEFESPGGSKMRIHWKATAPPDWAGVLRAWRDAER